ISTLFAEYLGYFLHFTPGQVHWAAAGAIVMVGVFNYLGARSAALVMNATTAAKYGALVLLGLLAFVAGAGDWGHFTTLPAGAVAPTVSLFTAALIPVMWTYDGWADLSFMGGEVRDPARNLPRALIIGTGLIVVVYLLMNFAYLYLVPIDEMAKSPLITTTAATRVPLLGDRGTAVVAAMVMLSAFGGLLGSMMTGPRIFFAMADRGLFFQGIARVSPRWKSPSVAIWLATGLGVVYVLLNDFERLADKFILGIWPFYSLAVAAVFILRKRRPEMERPYRAWGYPVVPALFLLASVAMVLNALWTDPVNTGITFGIILAGVPAYGVWRWWAARGVTIS
ncbi:MAG TPA: amino acid permease, partial [Gemmatimonadales bacterium]|nr:amino acid permease [Gemmatimonadales bacterium]